MVYIWKLLCKSSDGGSTYETPATMNGWLTTANAAGLPIHGGIWQYHPVGSGTPTPQQWVTQTYSGL